MNKVRNSLLLSLAESYSAMAIQVVSMVILARILTPRDIGIFSVAAAFVAIASTIRDFGVAEYLIQVKELDNDRIRAALTANIVISWSVGALIFFASTALARFFAESGVGEILRVSAINFLLIPFGAVTMAYFRRELNFVPIYWATLISGFVMAITSVVLAWQGWGYMGLAWSGVAGVVSAVLVASYFRPRDFPWLPGLQQLGEVARFGTYASSIYILKRLGAGAPDMIIGRIISMEAVGLFSRATGIAELFNRSVLVAVHRVALPYFSEQIRLGRAAKEGFLSALSYVTVVGWPFLATLGLLALPAIRLIYGDQWISAVPILQILSLGFAIEISFFLAGEVLIAIGRVACGARLQVYMQLIRIIAILIATPFGLAAAAIGYVTGTVLAALFVAIALRASIGVTWGDLGQVAVRSGLISVLTILPVLLVVLFMDVSVERYLLPLLLASFGAGAVWLAVLLGTRHPLGNHLTESIRVARTHRSWASLVS